jgi:hypothetical protein
MTIECTKTRTPLALQVPTTLGSDWLGEVRLSFLPERSVEYRVQRALRRIYC